MNCSNCLNDYDFSKHKPFAILFCCHTFCLDCIKTLKNQTNKCQRCKQEITAFKPNYSLIELINERKDSNQPTESPSVEQSVSSLNYAKVKEE